KPADVLVRLRLLPGLLPEEDLVVKQVKQGLGRAAQFGVALQVDFEGRAGVRLPAAALLVHQSVEEIGGRVGFRGGAWGGQKVGTRRLTHGSCLPTRAGRLARRYGSGQRRTVWSALPLRPRRPSGENA